MGCVFRDVSTAICRSLAVLAVAVVVLAGCLSPARAEVAAQEEIRSLSFKRTTVRGIPVNAIYVNLEHPNVRLSADVSEYGIGTSESFGSFIDRTKPAAAVNGTFFCTISLHPIGDIVANGHLLHFGGMGTGLCISPEKDVAFVTPPRYRHVSWEGYETVVCGGPRLLAGSKACLAPRHEGFRDPHVLGRARRTAVGLTYMNRLLLVTTSDPCTLTQLALVMKDLGCTDSINLDGGSSCGMYYRGTTVTSPGRDLTNVLLVYD